MSVLPAAAVLAAVVVLAAIASMLARSEPYSLPLAPKKPTGRHSRSAVAAPYLPRSWDEATTDEVAAVAPVSAPPVPAPIDELDPAWDWEGYLADLESAAARELVTA